MLRPAPAPERSSSRRSDLRIFVLQELGDRFNRALSTDLTESSEGSSAHCGVLIREQTAEGGYSGRILDLAQRPYGLRTHVRVGIA